MNPAGRSSHTPSLQGAQSSAERAALASEILQTKSGLTKEQADAAVNAIKAYGPKKMETELFAYMEAKRKFVENQEARARLNEARAEFQEKIGVLRVQLVDKLRAISRVAEAISQRVGGEIGSSAKAFSARSRELEVKAITADLLDNELRENLKADVKTLGSDVSALRERARAVINQNKNI